MERSDRRPVIVTRCAPTWTAVSSSPGRPHRGTVPRPPIRFDPPLPAFWDDADLLGFVGDEPGRFIERLNLSPTTAAPVLVGFNAGSVARTVLAGSGPPGIRERAVSPAQRSGDIE